MRIAYTLGGATYEANGLWTCADDHCVILVFDRTLKAVKPADAALGLILLSRDRVQFSETSAPKPRNDCWFTASCSRVAPQNNRVAFGTFSLENGRIQDRLSKELGPRSEVIRWTNRISDGFNDSRTFARR